MKYCEEKKKKKNERKKTKRKQKSQSLQCLKVKQVLGFSMTCFPFKAGWRNGEITQKGLHFDRTPAQFRYILMNIN